MQSAVPLPTLQAAADSFNKLSLVSLKQLEVLLLGTPGKAVGLVNRHSLGGGSTGTLPVRPCLSPFGSDSPFQMQMLSTEHRDLPHTG